MPTINRNPIKPERVKSITITDDPSNYYGSLAWKRLRQTFITEHPVCYECLQHNRVTPTKDVHHKQNFYGGHNEEERWSLFLNENNLIALCECCHYGYHRKMKKYNLKECLGLTEKEYKEAHNEYTE